MDPQTNLQELLVSKLVLAGDLTARLDDHVAYFAREHPCRADGIEIQQIKNASAHRTLADGVEVDHTFSAKPQPSGNYEDYYAKVTTYIGILSGPAQSIDPSVTVKTFALSVPEKEDDTVFKYLDARRDSNPQPSVPKTNGRSVKPYSLGTRDFHILQISQGSGRV